MPMQAGSLARQGDKLFKISDIVRMNPWMHRLGYDKPGLGKVLDTVEDPKFLEDAADGARMQAFPENSLDRRHLPRGDAPVAPRNWPTANAEGPT